MHAKALTLENQGKLSLEKKREMYSEALYLTLPHKKTTKELRKWYFTMAEVSSANSLAQAEDRLGNGEKYIELLYIVNILKLGEFQYSILMAFMAFGGLIGSSVAMIPQIAVNIKQISSVSTFLMGMLLLTVIFIPEFGFMCGICIVSGTLSSLIMVYYSTELFVKCEESEIRSVSGHFGICMDMTEMVSKPIAGGLDRMVGPIISLVLMGVCFIVCTPINYKLKKMSDVNTDNVMKGGEVK